MKKLLAISVLAIMLILVTVTGVNATTNSTLADELYALGAKYGMTSAQRKQAQNYLTNNPVSEEEANQIMAKAHEAADLLDEAGVKNVFEDKDKLSAANISELKSLANQAAAIAGATLGIHVTADGVDVDIYKDGVKVDNVNLSGKAVNTGSNLNVFLVVSAVASIALVSVFVTRKNLANA